MSIFPSETVNVSDLIQTTVDSSAELPTLYEYAWDYENNDFLLVDEKNIILTGLDALKVWIWKALHTPRYRFLAYTWNFGNELDETVNQGLSTDALKSEIERYLGEALLVNPYITGIKDISIVIEGSKVDASFTVTTVYGEADVNV